MTRLTLLSPLPGWVSPLDEVPDAVFAGGMIGDGVAIDPTGAQLVAPCAATVLSVHAGRHAVTLRTDDGADVLIHLGIDTVALGGAGFTVRVAAGQRVATGDPLVDLDLDRLLAAATSMVTPVLVTDTDAFEVVERHPGGAVAIGEPLLVIARRGAADAADDAAQEAGIARDVVVPLAHGLHARPAARIAEAVRGLDARVTIAKGAAQASATGVTALLALDVRLGDTVTLRASGPDAADAIERLATLIEGGMGEAAPAAPVAAAPVAEPLPPLPDGTLRGVAAAPGLAIGTARWLAARDRAVERDGAGADAERARLDAALAQARGALDAATGPAAAIMAAHRGLLDDPDLIEAAQRQIAAGRSAGHAWRHALRAQAKALRATGNPRLAERADDLLDVERRVLAVLAGESDAPAAPAYPAGTILLADDLLPSDVAGLGDGAVVGLCSTRGGPTSHVAILAAGLGIPALVAIGGPLAEVAEGATLILDADAATLAVDPAPAALAAARARADAVTQRRAAVRAAAAEAAHTRDGVRIEAFANLGSVADAQAAVAAGAEGCGLLRTEFLFLDRATPPDADEQAALYRAVADTLDGRPVIVRLLDIGGDKPAPWLPLPAEENPALGVRGIRVGLRHRDVLDTQLRAILSAGAACRIMLPMVASVAELTEVRGAVERLRADMGVAHAVQVGVMVETPAAAITADLLARHADFLSIGTNDLTQYTLAMDRGNDGVAGGVDGLHPAVLRLIGETCRGAARHARWTGVCGGLASDPLAVPILIGLGVTELSATPALVPEVKAAIRAATLADCRDLAARAVAADSAGAVRDLARAFAREMVAGETAA
ncbi:phosphoenolpyruvate--protein phosphotransferase [uncultured Sphingomonas sp.]|uniref:phosphoenolpyruvate--protein phosphotransferase n=1 Tax=uncultured Sphingomonas sp. TaxID=158754 RepID=UPI0030DA7661